MALLSLSDPGLKSDTGGGRNSGEAAMIAKDELFVYKGYGGLKTAKKERGCAAKERISKLPPFAARKSSSIYRDGLVNMKLTFGTKVLGIRIRTRKESENPKASCFYFWQRYTFQSRG
ncbi:AP2-like ethylene-responsive transcription factor At2g41710 [Quercus robur]|uniref:AP2-like ethylene-responsive transcription factor At2g41710 n=1 Tax=Quercus robur TaxID=38942 RepID=UPI002163E464|nr:AP2-like ethylene-responsive transcription factor At2g41710 [Quercus robur]